MDRNSSPLSRASGCCAVALVLLLAAAPAVAQNVTYPILIYSTSVGQHDVSVTIDVAGASQATRLCATTHQAGYHIGSYVWSDWSRRDDAAGISLNGGPFVADWNSTGTVDYPADRYEGVGGAYHTVRVCWATSDLGTVTEGVNTLTFRFYGVRDEARSGYRVLDIDVEDAGGTDLITGESYDDPEGWTIANTVGSAYDNATVISEGAALWSARNSLVEIASGASMTAACSDCHATSGFDLQYFNYESDVIVTRAAHHGLTEDEGRKIAAYIRSLDLNRTDGRDTAPLGRPWNPPYQPGIGHDGQPLTAGLEEDWAAGAGIDFVLAHDHETFDYLFSQNGTTPNPNPSSADIAATFHVGDLLDSTTPAGFGNIIRTQDIPVAIQYPDWNNWLPDVHPLDGYSGYPGSQLQTDLETTVPEAYDTQAEVDNTVSQYRNFWSGGAVGVGPGNPRIVRDFYKIDQRHDSWGRANGIIADYATDPAKYYLTQTSLTAAQAVKTFEVFNLLPMKDLADDIAQGVTVPSGRPGAGEPVRLRGSLGTEDPAFMWPSGQNLVFFYAPHVNGDPVFPDEGSYGPSGTALMQYYFSTAWYDVQLVLSSENNGIPCCNGGQPVDWQYMDALASNLQSSSGESQFARRLRQRVFAWQSRNNFWTRARPDDNRGFSRIIFTNLFELFGRAPSFPSSWPGALHPDQAEAEALTWAAIAEWTEFVSSVPISDWPRGRDDINAWTPSDYTPTLYGGGYRFEQPNAGNTSIEWADNVYRVAELMEQRNAPSQIISDLATWGESMWPNGDWERWFVEDPPPGETVGQTIQLDTGWNLISSYVAPTDSAMAAIWAPLTDRATTVRDAQGREFDPSTGSGSLGFWRRGEAYQVHMTEPATLTLQGEVVAPEATPIVLSEGWNQVAYLGTSQAPVADALSAILSDIVVVKQNDGSIFLPGFNLDQVGMLRPGLGYKLLLSDDAILVYPPLSETRNTPDVSMSGIGLGSQGKRSFRNAQSPQ